MSLSDPLGDMLTRIRNAQRARQTMCVAPASMLRANVLDVLKRVLASSATMAIVQSLLAYSRDAEDVVPPE